MHPQDDDLGHFEAHGAPDLPRATTEGYVDTRGARIAYATYGEGPPVLLLHGGLGHGGNWAYQVPALVAHGHRVVLVDTRGHGRSTRDGRPFTYDLLASDVLAVMNALQIERAPLVGWSDGACTSLVLASTSPTRVSGVFFFACNVDPSGAKPFAMTPVIERCLSRHRKDYARLSATPGDFRAFMDAVTAMQTTEPNYAAQDLAAVTVPVTVVLGERDEFIRREHAEHVARHIPGARFVLLPDVSHFAPLQRPETFNDVLLTFLSGLETGSS